MSELSEGKVKGGKNGGHGCIREPGNGCIRVLGIDPAAAGPTGYGVVESDGRKCRMVHYGALTIPEKRRKESAGAALQDVHAVLSKLIEEFEPDAVAVEAVFAALNVRTALRLAEVRGVVLLVAAQHDVAIYSYSPREVKASVAGYGHADKQQMQMMVRTLLAMTEIPEPTHAADALAVALCHLQVQQTSNRFGLPDIKKTNSRRLAAIARAADGSSSNSRVRATNAVLARIVTTR